MASDPVSLGLGALGTIMGNGQAQQQAKDEHGAMKLSKQQAQLQLAALRKMMGMADAYDPHGETQAAVQQASSVTGDTLDKSLRGLAARFRAGGGDPGLSSEFAVKAQGMTNRVTDPLRQFIADRASTDTERKMNAYRMAVGSTPGNLGDSYFRMAASMPGGDTSGSLAMLLQGLKGAFSKGGGAGGSGDVVANGGKRLPWDEQYESPWRPGSNGLEYPDYNPYG